MCGVAVRACCCHCQSALHQTLAVNALGVMFDDLVLGSRIPHRSFLSFAMTLGTQSRDVRSKRRRHGFEFPFHSMRPVTFLARRSIGIVLRNKLTMHTHLVLLTDLGMA